MIFAIAIIRDDGTVLRIDRNGDTNPPAADRETLLAARAAIEAALQEVSDEAAS